MKKPLIALLALTLTVTAASAQTTTAPGGATTTTGSDANQNARHARTAGKGGMAKAKKSPAEKADHKAAKMAKQLGLNAGQEAKVESLLLAQDQEMKTLKAKYAGTTNRDAMKPEAKAIHDKYEGQLKAVLGTDTYARYDKMRDEHHDKGKAGHGPKDGKVKVKAKS